MRDKFKLHLGGLDIGNRIRQKALFMAVGNSDLDNKEILDAGCGAGDNGLRLAYRYPGARVEGIDIDRENLTVAACIRKKMAIYNFNLKSVDIAAPFAIGRFDLVFCIDVLEHILNDRAAINNLSKSLKRGGTLIIHTPLISQRRYFKKFHDWHQSDHVRNGYEEEKLTAMLDEFGLDRVDQKYTFGGCGALAWEIYETAKSKNALLKLMASLAVMPLAALDSLVKNNRGNGLLIKARKA